LVSKYMLKRTYTCTLARARNDEFGNSTVTEIDLKPVLIINSISHLPNSEMTMEISTYHWVIDNSHIKWELSIL
jgi:hypothetical protein